MENFWNKTAILVLGLLFGALSGFLSVYELSMYGTFVRPPLVFGVVALLCWSFVLRISLLRWILLFFLLQVAYVVVISFGYVFTGFYLLGAVLVFLAVVLVFELEEWMLLLKSLALFLVFGLFFDMNINHQWLDHLLVDEETRQPFGAVGYENPVFKLAIFVWQVSAMTAITLQLYAERRYRQQLAAQEAADGGASEP